ncbi:MAG: hypothetical protein MJ010_04140 [Paludibacteraceae bacterium]|nr:hypothetical protein [Paludibacteraceae bacterium]
MEAIKNGKHYLRYPLELEVLPTDVSKDTNRENFQAVTEGLKELGMLNIMPTSSKEDVFFITKEWETLMKDKNVIESLSRVPWIIPNKITPNWGEAFDDLVEVETSFVTNPKKVKMLVYDNIPRIKKVIDSLDNKQKYNFYVSLQNQMEQEALKDAEVK